MSAWIEKIRWFFVCRKRGHELEDDWRERQTTNGYRVYANCLGCGVEFRNMDTGNGIWTGWKSKSGRRLRDG